MAADFTIGFDDRLAILKIRAENFWSRDTQKAFEQALVAEMHALRDRKRPFTVFADASVYPVQSFAVSAGFMGIVHRLDRDLLVPTAIVATGALLRLQALRVLVAPHIRVFADHAAAFAWLAEKHAERG